jgi:PKD domain-containing protein
VLSGVPLNGDVGVYFVNVSVSDGVGGLDWSNFTLVVSTIDIIPFACFEWIDADDNGYGTSINFDASCSFDDFGIVLYEWDWDDNGVYDYSSVDDYASYDWGDLFIHEVTLRVTDTIGQTNIVKNTTVQASINIPPLIENIVVKPSIQYEGNFVNISCNVNDDDGIVDVMLNVTDPNGVYINQSMDADNGYYWVNDSYNVIGDYNFIIWAIDTYGISSTSTIYSFTIIEKTPPIAITNGPYYALVNESITFDGSSSYDLDGIIVNWTWDFGDSYIGYGETIIHKYAESGNYTVILKVMDDNGLIGLATTESIIGDNEYLDQSQDQLDYGYPIIESKYYAQSFKPNIDVITTIELLICKEGPVTKNLYVSIRENLDGSDIANIVLSPEEIPDSLSWISCDFSNLEITNEMNYYIIIYSPHTIYNSNYFYKWGCGYFTSYTDGSMWFSLSESFPWINLPIFDFCFKLYGYY